MVILVAPYFFLRMAILSDWGVVRERSYEFERSRNFAATSPARRSKHAEQFIRQLDGIATAPLRRETRVGGI